MIINSIEMTNFISHEKTLINFESGVNIITGKNGAGKTSILDAIKFALFSDSRNNEKIADLIKKGKNFFDLTLKFTINENNYELYKHFGMKSAKNTERTAYLKKDSVIIAETYEGVTSQIVKILGVSKEIFKDSVFVEQGEMDSLISGTPKERKTIFSDIIGITSLSKNADKLREIINGLRSESLLLSNSKDKMTSLIEENKNIDEENKKINIDYNIIRDKYNNYNNKLSEIENLIKERDKINTEIISNDNILRNYNEEISENTKRINEISEEISKYSNIEDELNSIESNVYYKNRDKISNYFNIKNKNNLILDSIKDLERKISDYNNYKKNLENLSYNYKKYLELREIYNRNKNEIKNSIEDYNKYNSKFSILKNMDDDISKITSYINGNISKYNIDIDNIKSERDKINVKITEYKNNITEIKSKVSSLNDKLKEYNTNIETLNGKSKCPLCGSELSKDHLNNIITEYNLEKENILKEINELGKNKKMYDNEIIKLQEKYDILNSTDVDKIISYNNQLKELNNKKNDLLREIEALKIKHDKYLELYNQNENYDNKINDLSESYENYNKYNSLISTINIDDVNRNLNDKTKELNENNEFINYTESSLNFVPEESEFKKINDLLSRIDKLREEYDKLNKLKNERDNLKKSIDDINKKIYNINSKISELRDNLNKYNGIDSEYENINKSLENAKMDQIKLKTTIENNNKRIDNNNKMIEYLRDDVNKYDKINNAIKKLNLIRESFDYNGIQSMIRKDSSSAITNSTRKYLLSFNLDFDDLSIDENFDIKISQNSSEQSIDSLSGGEKTALAIALRLSVAEYVLDKISTIIMDEPTNFLDEDRRNNLKDIIQYSLKGENLIPQLIIITHHSELTSVADISYEVIKNKGTSSVIS